MKYEKPQVLVIGAAINTIQSLEAKGIHAADCVQQPTASAYESNE
jgi:hypothetical protein